MKAKDTVMGNKKMALLTNQWETDLPTCDLAHCLIQAQAEISFKVGMGEVVNWVEAQRIAYTAECGTNFNFTNGEWRGKLKEWGIKP